MPDSDHAITLGEACRRLGIHRQTGYVWIREGRFPVRHFRLSNKIRVLASDLDRYLATAAGQ